MERQTQHMVRLIDDLLDVSRITRGKLQLRKTEVELAHVVQNAVDATRPFIDQAGHHLTVKLPQQPLRLLADPNRLAQVLMNLLHNAAKYTPSGGRIELLVEHDAPHIRIRVSDTGLGIPAEMQEHIFEMFAQVSRTMETGGGGLGIGLTLVKSLVEMHGGTIEVSSAGANRGSQFTVLLPAELLVHGSSQPAHAAPVEFGTAKRRVLVVDDNRDAAETLGAMVGLLGHEVKIAFDGAEALRAAELWLPDAILMDIGMPRLNGYEAARQIRAAGWGREMLLIATTGWGQEDDRRRTKEAGFNFHLVKPVEQTVVQALLAGSCEAAAP
jgi:CheY-like chemotaxis protein